MPLGKANRKLGISGLYQGVGLYLPLFRLASEINI
jgi:hypothetical protein